MQSDYFNDSLYRLLDANANRAMEALRTAEEFIRFILENQELSKQSRDLRHRLSHCIRQMFPDDRHLRARDTETDVGAGPALKDSGDRVDARDVCRAAFFRLKESVRTLEEYTKTFDTALSRKFEQVRYSAYDLEAATLLCEQS